MICSQIEEHNSFKRMCVLPLNLSTLSLLHQPTPMNRAACIPKELFLICFAYRNVYVICM